MKSLKYLFATSVILGNMLMFPLVFAAEEILEKQNSAGESNQRIAEGTSGLAVDQYQEMEKLQSTDIQETRETTADSIKEKTEDIESTESATEPSNIQETTDRMEEAMNNMQNSRFYTPYTEAYINKYFKVTWAENTCYLSNFKINNGTLPDANVVIPTSIKSDHWGNIPVVLGNSFYKNVRENEIVKKQLKSLKIVEGPGSYSVNNLFFDDDIQPDFHLLFSNCENLEEVDLSYLGANPNIRYYRGVDQIPSVAGMFQNCPKLKSVRIDSY
ncbi:hypothetical protein G8B32_13455, partial [Enterococcus faecalis]|uniref:hypothetical protein n=1 Tax=Enterococcus faecalis TaxID=1351 RepID=UPI001883A3ED